VSYLPAFEERLALLAAAGRALTARDRYGPNSPEYRAARGWATRRRRAFSDALQAATEQADAVRVEDGDTT